MNRMKRSLKEKIKLSLLVLGLSTTLIGSALAAPTKPPELKKITYKYLQKAQEQMAEDDFVAAKESLVHVLSKVKKKKYDSAAVNQMLAVVYANEENFDKALEHFKASLADDALFITAAQQVRYNLSQLHMMRGEYKEGVDVLKIWMANIAEGVEIPARAWIMLANGYSRMQQWENVVDPAKKAIAAAKEPKEAWYSLLLAAHYELKEIPKAIDVLEILVQLYPEKKKYWLQLSGMNMNIKQDAEALASLRAAYRHGVFDKDADYLRLANFLTFRQVPYKSGLVYQEGMDRGIVEKSYKNYKRLANFWTHAKETPRAIDAFQDALALQKEADLQLRLARMLAKAERYDELLKLIAKPAKDVKDKHIGNFTFLKAMAYYQLGDSRKSLKVMREAAGYKSSRGQAKSWISFLEQDVNSG